MFNSNSMYVMNCLYVKMLGLLFLVVFCCGKVQSQVKVMSMPAANGQTLSALTEEVIQGWRPFSINGAESFDAILKQKAEIEKNILSKNTKDKSAVLANTVWAIREVFLYYRENQSAEVNKKEIQKLLNKVSLLDFCNLHSLKWNVDCYYATKALVGGFTPSQVFGDKKDDLQYKTWKEVLETRDSVLIVNYFRGVVRHEFHFQGYTDVLRKCRSLFERCMPEGELKTEVIDLYMKHDRLEAGKEAPAFTMLDGEKREHTLAEFRGKIVIIDVWATWCGGCIKKLPYFIKVKEKYKDRKDVEFITVSIDDVGSFDKWKKFLEERGYTSGINLIAFARKNPFCDDYGIMGVPKYFIIGKDGKFLSRDVPGPGDGFEEMVDEVLSK